MIYNYRKNNRKLADKLNEISCQIVAESTTRLPNSVIKPSNCNNLRIFLVYSRHIDSRVFWGHLRQTYCQLSVHRQTLLLVCSIPEWVVWNICLHCW